MSLKITLIGETPCRIKSKNLQRRHFCKKAIIWNSSLLYLNRPKRIFFEKDRPLNSISLYEKFVYSFHNLQNKIFFLKIYSQIKSYNIFITSSLHHTLEFGEASVMLRILLDNKVKLKKMFKMNKNSVSKRYWTKHILHKKLNILGTPWWGAETDEVIIF